MLQFTEKSPEQKSIAEKIADSLAAEASLSFPGQYPRGTGDLANSNVLLGSFSINGKVYVLPTMENGKKIYDPASVAHGYGLEKYPQFNSVKEAEAWIQENHGRVNEDGTLSGRPFSGGALPDPETLAAQLNQGYPEIDETKDPESIAQLLVQKDYEEMGAAPPAGYKELGGGLRQELPTKEVKKHMTDVGWSAFQNQKRQAAGKALATTANTMQRFWDSATLGFAKKLGVRLIEDENVPDDVLTTVLGELGGFTGFLATPMKIGKGVAAVMGGRLARLAKTPKIARWLKYAIEGPTALGVATAVSDIPSLSKQVNESGDKISTIQTIAQRFGSGAAFGAVFAVTGMSGIAKSKVVNQAISQVGSRVLGNLVGMYSPEILKGAALTNEELGRAFWEELTYSWFSRKSTNPKRMNAEIAKWEKETKTKVSQAVIERLARPEETRRAEPIEEAPAEGVVGLEAIPENAQENVLSILKFNRSMDKTYITFDKIKSHPVVMSGRVEAKTLADFLGKNGLNVTGVEEWQRTLKEQVSGEKPVPEPVPEPILQDASRQGLTPELEARLLGWREKNTADYADIVDFGFELGKNPDDIADYLSKTGIAVTGREEAPKPEVPGERVMRARRQIEGKVAEKEQPARFEFGEKGLSLEPEQAADLPEGRFNEWLESRIGKGVPAQIRDLTEAARAQTLRHVEGRQDLAPEERPTEEPSTERETPGVYLQRWAEKFGAKPWEMTQAEFHEVLNKKYKKSGEAWYLLIENVGQRTIERVGSSKPSDILDHYIQKYNVTELTLSLSKEPTTKNSLGTYRLYESWYGKMTGEISINEDAIASLANRHGVNKDALRAGALRHEIEHALDLSKRDYNSPTQVKESPSPGDSLIGYIRGWMKDHFANYAAFETDYLHRSLVREADKLGLKVPDNVKSDVRNRDAATYMGREFDKLLADTLAKITGEKTLPTFEEADSKAKREAEDRAFEKTPEYKEFKAGKISDQVARLRWRQRTGQEKQGLPPPTEKPPGQAELEFGEGEFKSIDLRENKTFFEWKDKPIKDIEANKEKIGWHLYRELISHKKEMIELERMKAYETPEKGGKPGPEVLDDLYARKIISEKEYRDRLREHYGYDSMEKAEAEMAQEAEAKRKAQAEVRRVERYRERGEMAPQKLYEPEKVKEPPSFKDIRVPFDPDAIRRFRNAEGKRIRWPEGWEKGYHLTWGRDRVDQAVKALPKGWKYQIGPTNKADVFWVKLAGFKEGGGGEIPSPKKALKEGGLLFPVGEDISTTVRKIQFGQTHYAVNEKEIPADSLEAIRKAITPQEIRDALAIEEAKIARATTGKALLTSREAADLMSSVLKDRKVEHEIMVGENDAGQAHAWIQIDRKGYDPTSQGLGSPGESIAYYHPVNAPRGADPRLMDALPILRKWSRLIPRQHWGPIVEAVGDRWIGGKAKDLTLEHFIKREAKMLREKRPPERLEREKGDLGQEPETGFGEVPEGKKATAGYVEKAGEEAELSDVRKAVSEVLDSLSEKDRKVAEAWDMTDRQLGEELGVSHTQANKMRRDVFDKMRRNPKVQEAARQMSDKLEVQEAGEKGKGDPKKAYLKTIHRIINMPESLHFQEIEELPQGWKKVISDFGNKFVDFKDELLENWAAGSKKAADLIRLPQWSKFYRPLAEKLVDMEAESNRVSDKSFRMAQGFFTRDKDSIKRFGRAIEREEEINRRLRPEELAEEYDMTPAEAKAFIGMTRALDFIAKRWAPRVMRRAGVDEQRILEYLNSLEAQGAYWPHLRFGRYGVVTKGMSAQREMPFKKPPTLEFTAFETKREAQAYVDKVKSAGRIEDPHGSGYDIDPSSVKMVDLRDYNRDPATFVNMMRYLPALKAQFDQEGMSDFKAFAQEISSEYFKRFASGRFSHRNNVPGHSVDYQRALKSYLHSVPWSLLKRFSRPAVEDVIAGLPSGRRNYARDLVQFTFGEKDYEGKINRGIRRGMYDYFLGLKPSFGILNLTQRVQTLLPWAYHKARGGGVKSLMEAQGKELSFWRYYAKQRKNMGLSEAIRKATHLDGSKIFDITDTRVLTKLLEMGELGALRHKEITGESQSNVIEKLGFWSERSNRIVSALAGSAIAKRMNLNPYEAVEYAREAVQQTQFIYSKSTRMPIARGWKAPLFVFKSFSLNYLSLMRDFARTKDIPALSMGVAIFGAMSGLGGTIVYPILKDIVGTVAGAIGKKEDYFKTMDEFERNLNKHTNGMVMYGLPAMLNIQGDYAFGSSELFGLAPQGLYDSVKQFGRDIGRKGIDWWEKTKRLTPTEVRHVLRAIDLFQGKLPPTADGKPRVRDDILQRTPKHLRSYVKEIIDELPTIEDISTWEKVMYGIGFPTTKMTKYSEGSYRAKKIGQLGREQKGDTQKVIGKMMAQSLKDNEALSLRLSRMTPTDFKKAFNGLLKQMPERSRNKIKEMIMDWREKGNPITFSSVLGHLQDYL